MAIRRDVGEQRILVSMSIPEGTAASDINRELTAILFDAGRRAGFQVLLEYPVKGGRLDVVWGWYPADTFPGLDQVVPVVGFEVESSWRTRKHVKGDLLNLQDAGVALGVIVLAGTDVKDEGLRRFAQALVDRPGPTVLVWTADDVRALVSGVEAGRLPLPSAPSAAAATEPEPRGGGVMPTHAGKYASLYRWLVDLEATSVTTSFNEIEEVLGFPLPNSCRQHVAHWHSYEGSAVARAIIDAGWRASGVHVADEVLTLKRQPRSH